MRVIGRVFLIVFFITIGFRCSYGIELAHCDGIKEIYCQSQNIIEEICPSNNPQWVPLCELLGQENSNLLTLIQNSGCNNDITCI